MFIVCVGFEVDSQCHYTNFFLQIQMIFISTAFLYMLQWLLTYLSTTLFCHFGFCFWIHIQFLVPVIALFTILLPLDPHNMLAYKLETRVLLTPKPLSLALQLLPLFYLCHQKLSVKSGYGLTAFPLLPLLKQLWLHNGSVPLSFITYTNYFTLCLHLSSFCIHSPTSPTYYQPTSLCPHSKSTLLIILYPFAFFHVLHCISITQTYLYHTQLTFDL